MLREVRTKFHYPSLVILILFITFVIYGLTASGYIDQFIELGEMARDCGSRGFDPYKCTELKIEFLKLKEMEKQTLIFEKMLEKLYET